MKYAVEVYSCGVIYVPSFMKSSICVQVIFRFWLSNLGECNVGITDGNL
jgi:hypothetical protein